MSQSMNHLSWSWDSQPSIVPLFILEWIKVSGLDYEFYCFSHFSCSLAVCISSWNWSSLLETCVIYIYMFIYIYVLLLDLKYATVIALNCKCSIKWRRLVRVPYLLSCNEYFSSVTQAEMKFLFWSLSDVVCVMGGREFGPIHGPDVEKQNKQTNNPHFVTSVTSCLFHSWRGDKWLDSQFSMPAELFAYLNPSSPFVDFQLNQRQAMELSSALPWRTRYGLLLLGSALWPDLAKDMCWT